MSGPETKAEIARLVAEKKPLRDQIAEKSATIRKLIDQCPHEQRQPYRACGVETSVCIYCGHEVHVRDYNLHVNY